MTAIRNMMKFVIGAACCHLILGCAAPTPNEVRAVPPVFEIASKPKTAAFCECLLREADERVMIGLIATPIAKRLIPAGNGCELVVGDTVPYAILYADPRGAQVRMMRDITRPMDIYLSDQSYDQIFGGLRASVMQCFSDVR